MRQDKIYHRLGTLKNVQQASFDKTVKFYDQCLAGETDFAGIDLSNAVLDRLLLAQDCNFNNASFQNASLVDANMPGSSLQSANLQQANLTNANLERADLQGANLTGAVITNADFTDAIYDFSTRFDPGVAPSNLGMKTLAEIQAVKTTSTPEESGPEMSEFAPSPAESSNSTTQTKAKKTKEICYRGSCMTVEVDDTSEDTASEQTQVKEIWYRGSRTVVETKCADQSKKPKNWLNYRGNKL